MESISSSTSKLDRWSMLADRLVGIEWLFIFSCIDILAGFSFSNTFLGYFLPPEYIFVASASLNAVIIVSFVGYAVKSLDFAHIYSKWIRSSVREFGDITRLDDTVSICGMNRSSMEGCQFFKKSNSEYSSSLFIHEASMNSSLRQRSMNTTGPDQSSIVDRSFQPEDEQFTVLPATALISSKSPFLSHLFTEGHYNSMLFGGRRASSFDDDSSAGKKLNSWRSTTGFTDWLFNASGLSANDSSTGSYQIGFIIKDKTGGDEQMQQPKSEDSFSSHVHTELGVDEETEAIFTKKTSGALKQGVVAKRDALFKKVLEWHEDKEDLIKQKKIWALMEELFGIATVHRITFNSVIMTDLAVFSSNFRTFIGHCVIKPILTAIDETNEVLAKSSANFAIGKNPIEILIVALEQKPNLYSTKLPFLLPFLRLHQNQPYLISKFKRFVQESFLHEEYTIRRGFGSSNMESELLSEADFLFELFSIYMDYRMSANPFAASTEKPFSSVFVLRESDRPSFVHLTPQSFFIYARNKKGVSYNFVINGGLDFYYVTPTNETENLFSSFMLMLIYCKKYNDGYLGDMRIDSRGLDLLRLLNRSH